MGTPTDGGGVALSSGGSQGVVGHTTFWDFPATFTTAPTGADVTRSSPDGQWGIGRSTTQNRAARFSRTNGFDAFPNATTGLVPNTAYGSTSGGSVVVGYGLVNGASTHGFLWQQGLGTVDLGLAVGDRTSVLLDVSSGGDVSVGWGEPTASGLRHPLRYDSQGWTLLTTGGATFLDGGEARAVSGTGSVIVGTRTSSSAVRGFRWTGTASGGTVIDLASPANPSDPFLQTQAWDTSFDGAWTVGEAQDVGTGGAGTSIATVWDAQGVPHRLSVLLGNEPLHTAFELRTATSVSADGHTVSGVAFDPSSGQLRVYVATWTSGGTGGCAADLGGSGGQSGSDGSLDNNDFIVFINDFFAGSALADFGSAGGAPGPDGHFDNNDFIAFIDSFFAGC